MAHKNINILCALLSVLSFSSRAHLIQPFSEVIETLKSWHDDRDTTQPIPTGALHTGEGYFGTYFSIVGLSIDAPCTRLLSGDRQAAKSNTTRYNILEFLANNPEECKKYREQLIVLQKKIDAHLAWPKIVGEYKEIHKKFYEQKFQNNQSIL